MSAFVAPGPGTWVQLADHFPGPVTPEYARTFLATMPPANSTLASRYGIPLAGLDAAAVEGHLYLRPVPLIRPNARSLPPAALLRIGARVHPALRACARAASEALLERPWLAVADDWERRTRPAWIERNLDLQRVRVADLDDDGLAGHLLDCHRAWQDGYRLHFELHGSDQLPIAAYLVGGEALGIARDDLLAALTGWSPASRGADEHLDALRAAWRAADPTGAAPSSLDGLRGLGPAVALALDAYLEHHGDRVVTGYDLDGRTLRELPSLLLARLATDASPDPAIARAAAQRAAERVLSRVPVQRRDELGRLLGDAQRTYGLRDDNGGIVGAWPVGLTRRAYLEAGARLAGRGALDEPAHVLELLADELATLLRDQRGPSAAEAAARATTRAAQAAHPAPLRLGPPMVMPDPSVLPRGMALLTAAQLLLASDSGLATDERAADDGTSEVRGTGLGTEAIEARARVADDPHEALAALEPGEVLVTRSTNPAWNAVLPLCAALVVEEGGALSHAAIIARELGLPAVIGAAHATAVVRTGDLVRVDPTAGVARVTARTPS